MAENVSLSAAVRANLLALQSTTDLISRTQGRLSTGLRVAAAVDDPVSFFQAKSLNDRASDFSVKKGGIDQGISTITAATDAVTGIESMVQQLKGLILTAKSATTTTEVTNLVTQFNDLRTQINNLASDATYQGLNLVNGTGSTLTVNFSNDTASVLNVGSYDIRTSASGLNVHKLTSTTATDLDGAGFAFALQATSDIAAFTLSGNGGLLVTEEVSLTAFDFVTLTVGNLYGTTSFTLSVGTVDFVFGTQTVTLNVASTRTADVLGTVNNALITAGTYTAGTTINFYAVTQEQTDISAATITANLTFIRISGASVTYSAYTGLQAIKAVGVGFTTEFNNRITNLDSALTTLRSRAQTLGSNVALLQTRLDFTKAYANTLSTGAGKLTLADLNEEGANLLALQTRQQLGIQSLAFAGAAEQNILTLFR